MNHIQNSRHRKLKNRVRILFDRLTFDFLHFRGYQKIGLLGVICSLVSLLFPWFSDGHGLSRTAFSISVGYVGFSIIVVLAIISVSLFSRRTKSEMKSRSGINIPDHTIITFGGLMLGFLVFTAMNVIRGFLIFSKDIQIGNGPSIAMVGAIFVFSAGVIGYRTYKRELLETYVENSRTTSEMLEEYNAILSKDAPDKKNMSLPV